MRASRQNGVLLTRAVALLFVVCLAECAAEQRVNIRGSNQPSLIEKGNGGRSQRGGSCLSYGHSCWGAHGKRSGKDQPNENEEASTSHLSDWYLAKLLRRMSGASIFPARKLVPLENLSNSDLNAIFRARLDNDQDLTKLFKSEEGAGPGAEGAEADPQVKAKLLQMMKEVSDDK